MTTNYSGSMLRPTRPVGHSSQVSGWILPVVGMTNKPSKFDGGAPAWATGSYGYRKPASKGGHEHQGVDIYAKAGAAIVAPVSGRIKSMGSGKVSGNYVKVQGEDGREYYFAHMGSIHSGLARGQVIIAGAYLGGVGNSGNAAGTTPHLHFEVREGGKSVNPNSYLTGGTTRDSTPLSAITGLNTVEKMQAYIDEQVRAALFMQEQNARGPLGFDPSTFNQPQPPSEEELQREQTSKNQSMFGQTLNAMSSSLSGGTRTPMMKKSTALQEGGQDAPTAIEQRQIVTEVP